MCVCVCVCAHVCAPICVCTCVCGEGEREWAVLKVPCVFVVAIIISSNVPITWIVLSLCSDRPAVHVFVYLCCSTQTFSQQNLPQPMKLVAWSSGPFMKLAAYEMWSANVNPRDITCASTATPRWWQPLTWKRSRALVVRFWRLWSFCTTKGSLTVRWGFFVWLRAIVSVSLFNLWLIGVKCACRHLTSLILFGLNILKWPTLQDRRKAVRTTMLQQQKVQHN